MVPKSVQVLQSHESLCDDTRMSAWDFLFSSGPVDTGKAQIVLAYVLKKTAEAVILNQTNAKGMPTFMWSSFQFSSHRITALPQK